MSRANYILLLLLTAGCAQTSHQAVEANIGQPADWGTFESRLEVPGPIEFERIVAADWAVPRSGLLNLDHPEATAAGLTDGPEAIQIYMYAVRHPKHGLFLIDTGVDRATATRSKGDMAASWLVRGQMKLDDLQVHVDTRTWIEQQDEPLAGVFLTHLHLDHSMGLPDVPDGVPVYTGPGEATDSRFLHVFTRGTTNRTLKGKGTLQELQPDDGAGSGFDGLLDVFGDGSMLAVHIPGHTAGSLAFLIRTVEGPVLLTGDGSHTAWGWEHDVESGTYNNDPEGSRQSFARLRAFVAAHPEVTVHLGHQSHAQSAATRATAAR
jgi:glyoxylase-like metal-dependent hydrolase (beta-lactamase superfamily II)